MEKKKDWSFRIIIIGIIGIILCGMAIYCNESKVVVKDYQEYDYNRSTSSYKDNYSNSSSNYNSNSSSSKRYNSADYDKYGNYKPIESMTQEEKRQELIDMLSDSLY